TFYLHCFCFHFYSHHLDLHSFPTRRSSDLLEFFFRIIAYLRTKNLNFYNILSLPYIDTDHFDLLFDVLEDAGREGDSSFQRKQQMSDFIADIANTHAEDLKRLSTLIDNI